MRKGEPETGRERRRREREPGLTEEENGKKNRKFLKKTWRRGKFSSEKKGGALQVSRRLLGESSTKERSGRLSNRTVPLG